MALQDILKNLDPSRLGLKVLSEDELQDVQNTLTMMERTLMLSRR